MRAVPDKTVPPTSVRSGLVARATAVGIALGLCLAPLTATAGSAAPPPNVKRHRVEHQVDAVRVTALTWRTCEGGFECARIRLPLDYDRPNGPTVSVALLRARARDPQRRIGSLFLNPGGPGGSAKDIVIRSTEFLSPEILDRFDLIGMDPRGTNDSLRVRCFPSEAKAQAATEAMSRGFPYTPEQDAAYLSSATALANACNRFGQPLSGSMSTAEVARDMDVVRRALGEDKLNYLGWSYGSYLGQVYANLFPDRVRVLAIDGVIDPQAWVGTPDTAGLPQAMRLGSAHGSHRALLEVLDRCAQAGADRCPLGPDPVAAFTALTEQLKAQPIQAVTEDGTTFELTYPALIESLQLMLYHAELVEGVPEVIAMVQVLADPEAEVWQRRQAGTGYTRSLHRTEQTDRAGGYRQRYENGYDLTSAVMCSDSLNPGLGADWTALARQADAEAPWFGRSWMWDSAPCAAWTAMDEDGYRGPFNRVTSATILVVGNRYDPATSYESAVRADQVLANSVLLSSESWGHTAYGSSQCVDSAVDRYLIEAVAPAPGTQCVGDVQPYQN